MMAKPMKTLELHYLMIQFLIISHIRVALTSFSKRGQVRNLSNGNEFDLQDNLSARKRHFNQSINQSIFPGVV